MHCPLWGDTGMAKRSSLPAMNLQWCDASFEPSQPVPALPSYLVGIAELVLNCFLIVSFVVCIYSLSSVGKLYKDHILILFSKEFTWHFGELGIFPIRAHVMSKFCMLTSLRIKALRKINHVGRKSF